MLWRMRRHFLATLVAASAIAVGSFCPREAAAQQAAPAAGVSDEVRLKDGSAFRGTITERVPNDHVDLLMPNGQTRRFPMGEVVYAGAAAGGGGGAPEPAITVRANKVDLHVASDQPDVQLLVRVGQSEATGWTYRGAISLEGRDYAIVCTAPCDAQLPSGLQRLALSQHGDHTVEADDPIDLRSSSTMYVHYDSRAAVRAVGYVIAAASAITGIVLIFTSIDFSCSQAQQNAGQCSVVNTTPLIAGLAVIIVGGIVGGVMAGISDHATIQLVPTMSSSPLRLPGASEPLVATTPETPGLGLRVRF
jgi:hypothetical protein